MADKLQRITIGFQASRARPARERRAARPPARADIGGEGWHELEAEDGRIALDLENVVWLRTDADEQRVGFGVGGWPGAGPSRSRHDHAGRARRGAEARGRDASRPRRRR